MIVFVSNGFMSVIQPNIFHLCNQSGFDIIIVQMIFTKFTRKNDCVDTYATGNDDSFRSVVSRDILGHLISSKRHVEWIKSLCCHQTTLRCLCLSHMSLSRTLVFVPSWRLWAKWRGNDAIMSMDSLSLNEVKGQRWFHVYAVIMMSHPVHTVTVYTKRHRVCSHVAFNITT